jgi:D-aminopeptidase
MDGRGCECGRGRAAWGKNKIAPYRLNPPFTFEVEFLNSFQAEQPMLLPQVKRSSPRAVAFSSNDYLEGFKLMRAIIPLAGIAG